MEPRAENWARAQFHYLLNGKPAGMRCIQLGDDARCLIFGQPGRPAVCSGLMPSAEMCGHDTGQAMRFLDELEVLTHP